MISPLLTSKENNDIKYSLQRSRRRYYLTTLWLLLPCPFTKESISMNAPVVLTAHKQAQAVAVVCHGLNNRPDAMDGVCAWLTPNTTVVRVALAGHTAKPKADEQNWLNLWTQQLQEATAQAVEIAKAANLPLYFIGFSLAGVVWLNMLADMKSAANPYTKAVLLAPALCFNLKMRLISVLHFSGLRHLPSFNRPHLRAHSWLPLSMYRGLFQGIHALSKTCSPHWQLPVLVLMDPKDELIRFSAVQKWLLARNLPWSFIPQPLSLPPWVYGHHLLIDQETVGALRWQEMQTLLVNFLQKK